MEEIWKPIAGFEGWYEVSNLGNVRSLDRDLEPSRTRFGGTRVMRYKGRTLQFRPDHKGYLRVGIVRGAKRSGSDKYVAHLVLAAFVGQRPEGMEACHCDGNKLNNRLDNLRWDTPINNQFDKRLHGTHGEGEKHSQAKLNSLIVRVIRRASEKKYFNAKELAELFNVSVKQVRDIIARRQWKCVA